MTLKILRIRAWRTAAPESCALAIVSLRAQPSRSVLAILGIIIGIILLFAVIAGFEARRSRRGSSPDAH